MTAPFAHRFRSLPAHHPARLHRPVRSARAAAGRALYPRVGRRAASSKRIAACASPASRRSPTSTNATCCACPAASAPWRRIEDAGYLAAIRRLGARARYITSVCTGSLLLAAAGLLRGKRAACHWAWRDQLAEFGVTPDPARVVRDGNVFTGGGVTAGNRHGARGHGRDRRPRPAPRPCSWRSNTRRRRRSTPAVPSLRANRYCARRAARLDAVRPERDAAIRRAAAALGERLICLRRALLCAFEPRQRRPAPVDTCASRSSASRARRTAAASP